MRRKRGARVGAAGQLPGLRAPLAPPAYDDAEAHVAELMNGSDRATALVGGALVEAALLKALKSRLLVPGKAAEKKLFSGIDAPLSAFSSRIRIGRALGLYGPHTEVVLEAIRKTRNRFAHNVTPLAFATDAGIAKEMAILDAPNLPIVVDAAPEQARRLRFAMVCTYLAQALGFHAIEMPSRPTPWPLP